MAGTDVIKTQIKSKLSALQTFEYNKAVTNAADNFKDDLKSTTGVVSKTINDFTSKTQGRTLNKKDIFEQIINTVESVIGSNKDSINPNEKPIVKSKLLKYSKEAAQIALQSSGQILLNETKKSFFGTTGMCDDMTPTGTGTTSLSPKEFDFINILSVNPESTSGRIMYENNIDTGFGSIKFNRELYTNFDSGLSYSFNLRDNSQLFSIIWDTPSQKYDVTINNSREYTDFLENYYNTIEYPDIKYVMASAMQMILQGDGTESKMLNDGMKLLNRLSTKLLSVCGSPASTKPMVNNTPEQVSEDEYELENYFNFDDIEGIDIDEEDAQLRRVLKFRDCDNFEIPLNSNHIEDFSYLLSTKNIDDNIINTLNKVSLDAYEQSGGSNSSIDLDGFQLSIMNSYILKIPKAIMGVILSPKMIFPIALIYKKLKSETLSVKELMKKLYKLFTNVITNVFWKFVKEFWRFVKRDLLNFVKSVASTILSNKLKKIKAIIKVLINIILKALDTGIQCCQDIFSAILNAITSSLNRKVSIPIPGLLLALSDKLPGYSSDRAYLNVIEKLESSGINTGPIYGTENKLPSLIKSILDGHGQEMDENSYVKVGLHTTTIPANGTNAYIIEGLVTASGKLF